VWGAKKTTSTKWVTEKRRAQKYRKRPKQIEGLSRKTQTGRQKAIKKNLVAGKKAQRPDGQCQPLRIPIGEGFIKLREVGGGEIKRKTGFRKATGKQQEDEGTPNPALRIFTTNIT